MPCPAQAVALGWQLLTVMLPACLCVVSVAVFLCCAQLSGGVRAFVVAERRVEGNTTSCFHIKVGCGLLAAAVVLGEGSTHHCNSWFSTAGKQRLTGGHN